MQSDVLKRLDSIHHKLSLLMQKYQEKEEQVVRQTAEIVVLQQKLSEQQVTIDKLFQQQRVLKLGKRLEDINLGTRDLKEELDQFIEEIDLCISLLSTL